MFDNGDLIRFLPELLLTVLATLIMVGDAALGERRPKGVLAYVALAGLAAALATALVVNQNQGSAFNKFLILDGFGGFFRVLVMGVGLLSVLASIPYLKQEHAESGEYYSLMLFSVVGQCLMVTASELIMVFIGLEISSIATYILCGYLRDDKRNNESAVKYFLLGSFATAFLLYGIAWIYGESGSTNLQAIQAHLNDPNAVRNFTMVAVSAALMFVGLAFKVSAAPFQIWAPDVYQGAPVPVTAFMSTGPKAAAFAVFVRVYMTAFQPISGRWTMLLWSSALLTMCIGNFAALIQNNIKRVLAYSAIAHAGYIMIALTADSQIGVEAIMFYLASYAVMNIGAFAVVSHVSGKGEKYLDVNDFAGLSMRQPVTAALLSVFLLSLIGVPLTGGFFAKFYIFKAALDSHLVWLTLLGLLNSAIAAYYYLRIIFVMYMAEPGESVNALKPISPALGVTVWGAAAATLFLGIFPSFVLNLAKQGAVLGK